MDVRAAIARRNENATPILRRFEEAARDVKDAERTVTYVASDETVDRYGDIVSVDGWDLKNFRNNRVFLWMHRQDMPPIGEVKRVWVEDSKLLATVKFLEAGANKFVDQLWDLVRKKILRAVSVGFNADAKDIEPIRDENERTTGFRFLKQELLELSLVNVPANPNALQIARSLGMAPEHIRAALPLDALVTGEQLAARQRLAAIQLRGIKASAPR